MLPRLQFILSFIYKHVSQNSQNLDFFVWSNFNKFEEKDMEFLQIAIFFKSIFQVRLRNLC